MVNPLCLVCVDRVVEDGPWTQDHIAPASHLLQDCAVGGGGHRAGHPRQEDNHREGTSRARGEDVKMMVKLSEYLRVNAGEVNFIWSWQEGIYSCDEDSLEGKEKKCFCVHFG